MKEVSNLVKLMAQNAFGHYDYALLRELATSGLLTYDSNVMETFQDKTRILSHVMEFMLMYPGRSVYFSPIVNELGIDKVADMFIDHLKENHDSIRKDVSGELESMNRKMNCIINTLIKDENEG